MKNRLNWFAFVCSYSIPLLCVAALLLAACDGFHIIPDLSHLVVHLLSVFPLCLSQSYLEFPLHTLQLFLVTFLECPFLPVKDILYTTHNPGLVVRETTHSFNGNYNIHTEVQVVRCAVCDLSMSSLCASCRTPQSVDSKQSLRASTASGDHFLKECAVMGCLWICGLYCGLSRIMI